MKPLFFAVLLFSCAALAQEDQLIATLKSDASPREKADACRELAHMGTSQAVPALVPLLADEQLSQMARTALEPLADPAVDAALREALGKLKGRLLVGVISSLGVRKDTHAVEALANLLSDPEPAVAQAAARALGSIGGAGLTALQRALPTSSGANQLAVCEGLLRCAEALPGPEAAAISDQLLGLPNLPHHVRVAALRGAIRNRGPKGLPLLSEALRTESPVPAADVIRIALELPGPKVTRLLVKELAQANPNKQLLLVHALGNRGDATAASGLTALAQHGAVELRVAAIRSLVQLAAPSALPVLAALTKAPEPSVSSAALSGLVGFPGTKADAVVVALLNGADAKARIAVLDAIGQRRITTATPALLKGASDPDAGVASASFKLLGELGGVSEIPGLLKAMFQTKELAAAESALVALCVRQPEPASCAEKLLPSLSKASGEPKLALLRVLGAVNSPKALVAMRAAAADSDASVRDTALRALCDWPTPDALPDLARLASADVERKFKVLALRGQLRLIPAQTAPDGQKLAQLKQILPLLNRQEEQRLALLALADIPTAESLALVLSYLSNEAFKQEASVAAVAIGEKIAARHPAEVAEALQRVQTNNAQLAERVKQLVAHLPACATPAGFTSLFNGKDLSGWEGKPGWWSVQEGALTVESTADKPCKECNYLMWREGQPADFELLADFKLSQAANSGIQLRSEERPNWDTYGYQADMTGDGALVGFVYHHKRGLIAGRGDKALFDAEGKPTTERLGEPAELLKHFKPGEWNTYRVVCHGPDITLYVNGTLMCQISDHHATQAASRGIIALQMHPGPPMKIQFKNIYLKELK